MAQTVHLKLEIDGNDIEGESSIASMDREGTIECASFTYEVVAPYEKGSADAAVHRRHMPVSIHKRIDKSTPFLLKALCEGELVTRAEFRFFRPSTHRDGAEEQFYTVLLENAHISAVKQLSEDAVMAGEMAPPIMEEVSFVFQDITWTHEIGGETHKDSWKGES